MHFSLGCGAIARKSIFRGRKWSHTRSRHIQQLEPRTLLSAWNTIATLPTNSQPDSMVADNAGNTYGTTGDGVVREQTPYTTWNTIYQNPDHAALFCSAVDAKGDLFVGGEDALTGQGIILEKLAGKSQFTPIYQIAYTSSFQFPEVSGLTVDAAGNLFACGSAVESDGGHSLVWERPAGQTIFKTVDEYAHDPLPRAHDSIYNWTTPRAITSVPSGPYAGLYVVGTYYTVGDRKRHWMARKSSDGGKTWSTIDSYQLDATGGNADAIAVSSDKAGNIYVAGTAATGGSSTIPHGIVRKSSNGGATWTVSHDFGPSSGAASIVMDPHTGTMYAGGQAVEGGSTHSIIQSNAGGSWSTVDDFQPQAGANAQLVALAARSDGNLYASIYGQSSGWIIRTFCSSCTIRALTYTDLNGDGSFDGNDTVITGAKVYLDFNANGNLDAGEPTGVTGSDGTFTFNNLSSGIYHVGAVASSAYIPEHKTGVTFTLISNSTEVDLGFAQKFPFGSISFKAYEDVDGSGFFDNSDATLAGLSVYLDLNKNGARDPGEPGGITDSAGSFVFSTVAAGTYVLRCATPPGYRFELGDSAEGEPIVKVGSTDTIAFPFYRPENITGRVINAANNAAIGGTTVFIDQNKNFTLDLYEPRTTTDATGHFTFANLAPGDYFVADVPKPGYQRAIGNGEYDFKILSGVTTTPKDMGETVITGTITGTVFLDANKNGVKDSGEQGLSGWTVYADLNNNGTLDAADAQSTTDSSGNYSIALAQGTANIRFVLKQPWTQTNHPTTSVKITPKLTTAGPNFAVVVPNAGKISGVAFSDLNKNGVRDANESGVSGISLYLDSNNNGQFDNGEPTAGSDSSGNFSFSNIPAGTYTLRQLSLNGWRLVGSTAITVVVRAGQTTTINLPEFLGSTISGMVYQDVNGSGTDDAGDLPLPNVRVYLDLNQNGTLDTGEPSQVSNGSGNFLFSAISSGTYRLAVVVPSGKIQVAPAPPYYTINLTQPSTWTGSNFGLVNPAAPVTFSGIAFNDLNLDRVQQANEPGVAGCKFFIDLNRNGALDSGEPTALTNGAGIFTLPNVVTGQYRIGLVPPSGWRIAWRSAPAAISAGHAVTGLNFALTQQAFLASKVFIDANGDGQLEKGETGLSGWTVYIDANKNGKLDSGETSFVTLSDGSFWFPLAAGTYVIRVVPQAGYHSTSPASYTITLSPGQYATGYNFGFAAN